MKENEIISSLLDWLVSEGVIAESQRAAISGPLCLTIKNHFVLRPSLTELAQKQMESSLPLTIPFFPRQNTLAPSAAAIDYDLPSKVAAMDIT